MRPPRALRRAGRDTRRRLRNRWPTLALAGLAAVVVLAVALVLFPYHSSNHDEGVYLQQAALLLSGQLHLEPPVEGAFRPWFFVEGSAGLYAKYSPVVAAVFAPALAVGEPRLALAAVAAASTTLVVAVASRAFDHPTGLVAGVLLLCSPLFVLSSSVFLPYAPTFLLNLGFAYAYVRTCRDQSIRWGALAGLASGAAFFARPYTAVLFAAPFAVHALWTLPRERRAALHQFGALVGCGLGMVAVTLGYNAVVTGDLLVFPYEAFAPRDGLGFGERRLLEHSMDYTPARALTVNGYLLWYLATRWGPLGALGTALAVAGVILARPWDDDTATNGGAATDRAARTWLSDRQLRAILLGVAASVALGNLYFWGNANLLATPTDPGDGLLAVVGPVYHFDVLLPMATFAAYALVRAGRAIRGESGVLHGRTASFSARQRRAVVVAALLAFAPVVGAVSVATFGPPVERNAAYTDDHERAYEPFEPDPPTDAVVLLPTPYGPWLNHPFQYLRNEPGYDGETVYALDRDAETTWAVLEAFPDRTPHRYRYRGEWTPEPGRPVTPTLRATERTRTPELAATTTVGVPADATSATVTVSADGEAARTTLTPAGDSLVVDWRLTGESLAVDGASVPIEGPTRAVVSVVIVGPQGGTLGYEVEVLARPRGDDVEVMWPPEPRACLARADCDDAYVPGGNYPSFLEMETERR